ncbi:MAG: type III-B CRISPR module RAMP protein Cmr4 [Pyrobaculum sp.]
MGERFLLHALTPVHVGAGRAEDAHVDLPVQRDEFGLPVIWASSLKGALKNWAKTRPESQDCMNYIREIFGSEPGQNPTVPSGVSLLDARLLLLPARSSRGIWQYITSPHLLHLYMTYSSLVAPPAQSGSEERQCSPPQNFDGLKGSMYLSSGLEGEVYINEVRLSGKEDRNLTKFKECLVKKLKLFNKDKDIVVVPDNVFDKLVRRSMIIQYRVRLTENKTVARGALWSEEYLPQFSVLHSAAVCRNADLCEKLKKCVPDEAVFWAGGKETIGKGLLELVYI